VLEGEDAEVDTSVAQHLRDPLTHMLRNAVDHGIETPDVRRRKGKDPVGTVTLSARHEGGGIVVRMTDDGAGLDRARILARARSRGMVRDGETPADADLLRLVLEPGFSTAEAVTDLSGRGVGLDVVRRSVEALRGSVSLESRPGEGTTLTLRLPLTLALIEGFSVGVADETYVVPLESVVECLELPADRHEADAAGVLSLRGEPLPFLRLREFLAVPGAAPTRESVVVIRHDSGRAGVVVDALHGGGQAVIKPLGRVLRDVPGVSGSTILGNGRVGLILDVPVLLRQAVERSAA
jgi:two-component system chemotaxis sensor kinase CheA